MIENKEIFIYLADLDMKWHQSDFCHACKLVKFLFQNYIETCDKKTCRCVLTQNYHSLIHRQIKLFTKKFHFIYDHCHRSRHIFCVSLQKQK